MWCIILGFDKRDPAVICASPDLPSVSAFRSPVLVGSDEYASLLAIFTILRVIVFLVVIACLITLVSYAFCIR